jgi:hypothetical protein
MPNNFKQLVEAAIEKHKAELIAAQRPKIEQLKAELDNRSTQLIVELRNKLLQANRS